jgi:hypothetical protein
MIKLQNIENIDFYKNKKEEIKTLRACNIQFKKSINVDFISKYIEEEDRSKISIFFLKDEKNESSYKLKLVFFSKEEEILTGVTKSFFIEVHKDIDTFSAFHKISELAHINDINSIEEFDKEYNIFKKYLLLFNNDNNILINVLTDYINNHNELINIESLSITNSYNSFLSKNKNKLTKISNIFPITPIIDLQKFVQKTYFKASKQDRINDEKNYFKIQFMTYDFNIHAVCFKTDSFKVFNYNKENQYYQYKGENVEEEYLNILLQKTFSFKGKIATNKKDLPELSLKPKGNINYDALMNILVPELTQLNVENF